MIGETNVLSRLTTAVNVATVASTGSPPAEKLSALSPVAESCTITKVKKIVQFNPNKNHGRKGSDDYTGCPIINVPHESISPGSCCPKCETEGRKLKLAQLKPKKIVLLEGMPIVSGTRYYCDRYHCNLCGENFTSAEEMRLSEKPKYASSCGSSIVINRYAGGQPFHRTQMLQDMHGVPLADATQWDITNKLYENCVAKIFSALEDVAAQAKVHYFDDTPNRVLSLKANNKKAHTTAIIAHEGEKTIQLYYTGTAIARANLSALLIKRTVLFQLITMCDASSQNVPSFSKEVLLFTWVFCLCLVHGRRKFYEVMNSFKAECIFVLEIIGEVYKHERHCKNKGLNAESRLSYHQEYSAPLMEALHTWFEAQITHQFVEENSELGKAILYMLRHWEGLTQFLRVPGVPLDNSLCEQSIKVAIRHRRNSLFYRTTHGAEVGDAMMSVIRTATLNGVNTFEYLNVLQAHVKIVAATPHLFLPWNYQKTIESSQLPLAA